MTPPPIRLEQVTLRLGGRAVVRDLTGTMAPGSLTALAGPNGAGKSTLLKSIAGLIPRDAGSIAIGDRDRVKEERTEVLRLADSTSKRYRFTEPWRGC